MSRTKSSTLSWNFLPHTLSNFAATVRSFMSRYVDVKVNREDRMILISPTIFVEGSDSKDSYNTGVEMI